MTPAAAIVLVLLFAWDLFNDLSLRRYATQKFVAWLYRDDTEDGAR